MLDPESRNMSSPESMPFSCSSQGDGRVLVQDEDPYHVPSDVILSDEDRGCLKTILGQSAASADIQVKRGPSLSTDAPNPNHPSPPLNPTALSLPPGSSL